MSCFSSTRSNVKVPTTLQLRPWQFVFAQPVRSPGWSRSLLLVASERLSPIAGYQVIMET